MDWYQFFKDFAAPGATFIASVTAAVVSYSMGKKQYRFTKAQAEIAKRNSDAENEKVVLQLMDRRLAMYEEIREVIGEVIRTGRVNDELLWQYIKAIDRVPYLFGTEIESYLEALRLHLIKLQHGNKLVSDPANSDYRTGVEIEHREFQAVSNFYKEAKPLFRPYIRAHQKVADQSVAQ